MTSGRHNTKPYGNTGLTVIVDSLPVDQGGYAAGTIFSHTDTLKMLERCSFSTGTVVEFRGCRYQIVTITSPTGSKQIMAELEVVTTKG